MKKGSVKKANTRSWLIALAAAVLITAVIAVPVIAKYISTRRAPQSLVLTNNFYFTSNYLKEGGSAVTVNAGTSTLDIDLYNYDDMLRSTDEAIGAINYEISVSVTKADDSAAEQAVVNAVEINSSARTSFSGSIAAATQANPRQSSTVTLAGLANGYKYTVTAVGTHNNNQSTANGYVKTISATFTVAADEAHVYKYLEKHDDYAVLMVWTVGNVSGSAVITPPATLIPDNTDPAMANWETGATAKTDADNSFAGLYASHSYRFFYPTGYNDTSLSDTVFAVKVNGETATHSTP